MKTVWIAAGIGLMLLVGFFMLLGTTTVAAVPNPEPHVLDQIQAMVAEANSDRGGDADWQDVLAVLHVLLEADWDRYSQGYLANLLEHWYQKRTITVCDEDECWEETRWRTSSVDEVADRLELSEVELEWLALTRDTRQDIMLAARGGCVGEGWRPSPAAGWIWPLPGYTRVTSCFGPRIDPVYGGQRFHGGLDVGAPTGAKLVSPSPGTVRGTSTNVASACGRSVLIAHDNGYGTRYCHLSRVSVQAGQRVGSGQKIGEVGSTGKSTGPHMHLEILRAGSRLDPLLVFGQ